MPFTFAIPHQEEEQARAFIQHQYRLYYQYADFSVLASEHTAFTRTLDFLHSSTIQTTRL